MIASDELHAGRLAGDAAHMGDELAKFGDTLPKYRDGGSG